MRPLISWLAAPAAIVAAVPGWAAEPAPSIGPPPAWVTAPELPALDPGQANMPLQFLLSSSQERMRSDGLDHYVRYAAVPQTTVGLQALGNVIVPWNAERTGLVFHKVAIRRGGTVIDLLEPDDITVLRRENNLEKAMLDGVRTVVIPAKGLQIGDILDVAFSYTTKASSIGAKPEEIQQMASPLPLELVERRFLIPDNMAVRWNVSASIEPAKTVRRDGVTEHLFLAADVQPPTIPEHAPQRFRTPIIQVSSYADWSEISERLHPFYDQARRLPPQSPLIGEANRIAAASSDTGERMLAALRLTQDQVRYVALLLGEGAYVPASADETWERKFGDCKGKTALLLALLDRLGIEAEPILVSNQHNDQLGEMLPSLITFDHVLVRAAVDGQHYYLDPTDYGQRTLEELSGSPFRHGLPLRGGATLEALPDITLTAPYSEIALVWNGSEDLRDEVPFEATLILRGNVAATMRAKLAAATDVEEFDTGLKQLVPGITNDNLVIAEKNAEMKDGSFLVRFTGDAPMDWSPFEGERDTRYAFSHAAIKWDADFDRDEGPGKDWPVHLADRRYWERMTETVILPDGGKGYSVEAAPLEKAFAGSSASRSVRKDGDRITMVANFQHLKREISADEARAAVSVLEEINEDYAYIVGPPERKTRPKRED